MSSHNNAAALPGADAVNAIAHLANAGKGMVEFRALPAEMIPPGATVKSPHVAIITAPGAEPKIVSLNSHIDQIKGRPARIVGTAKATTLDSFIALVSRHKSANSAIFVDAEWTKPNLAAVIDYHHQRPDAADDVVGDNPAARYCNHRIAYAFPLSEPWKQWVFDDLRQREKRNKGMMNQAEFAAFLENHIHEIVSPTTAEEIDISRRFSTKAATPAEILDLSRGLEINVEASVKSRTKLASGESQIVFQTEHKDAAGADIIVPGMFLIGIPLFYEGDTKRVYVRLRYRAAGGDGILWGYELLRPDEAVNDAVRIAVANVTEQTGLPCYDGAPETSA